MSRFMDWARNKGLRVGIDWADAATTVFAKDPAYWLEYTNRRRISLMCTRSGETTTAGNWSWEQRHVSCVEFSWEEREAAYVALVIAG